MSQIAQLRTFPRQLETPPPSPMDRHLESRSQAIKIDILPDDVLLEVFDFYLGGVQEIEAWQLLAHVSRRWRCLLFGSPRRLNLQLVCTPRTPARALDIWPALPLVIQGHIFPTSGVDNTVVALRRSSYILKIDLWGSSGPASEEVLAAMQHPFPEITHLRLGAYDAPVVPDSFLGGSAPRLQYLHLERIPFPGLPKLLSSAIHLVELHLHRIPQSGYLSPEVMVTCLSALTSLERLSLGFQSPQSYPNRESRRPPPPKRSIFPALTHLQFRGVSEYLDDFVAQIKTLRLSNLHIIFFNQIDFDARQLAQFIKRTPKLNVPDEAHVIFHHEMVMIRFLSGGFGHAELHVEISCSGSEWQLSSLTQVCALCLPSLSTVKILYIDHLLSPGGWKNDHADAQWLDFLRPFDGTKSLYLSTIFASGVGTSLKELILDRITEVLPALQNIFTGRQKAEITNGIERFVDARRLSGYSFNISLNDNPLERRRLDWFKVEHFHDASPYRAPSPFAPPPGSPCRRSSAPQSARRYVTPSSPAHRFLTTQSARRYVPPSSPAHHSLTTQSARIYVPPSPPAHHSLTTQSARRYVPPSSPAHHSLTTQSARIYVPTSSPAYRSLITQSARR